MYYEKDISYSIKLIGIVATVISAGTVALAYSREDMAWLIFLIIAPIIFIIMFLIFFGMIKSYSH